MSGYYGYSMSNNAVSAYQEGSKPLSKWTKEEILKEVKRYNPDVVNELKKVKLSVLKDYLLSYDGWHHTSSYYNKTEFYDLDINKIEELTSDIIDRLKVQRPKKEEPEIIKYKGSIDYLEWGGTRTHPKAYEHTLSNVWIEEKGAFYIIYDDNDHIIMRKKMDSNGTYVHRYIED